MTITQQSVSDAAWKNVEAARAKLGLADAGALYQRLEASVSQLERALDLRFRRIRLTLPWPGEKLGRWYIVAGISDTGPQDSLIVPVTLEELLEASSGLADRIAEQAKAAVEAQEALQERVSVAEVPEPARPHPRPSQRAAAPNPASREAPKAHASPASSRSQQFSLGF
ncbi:hypothetical protein [Azospirillum sp. SYSU D00513]|uniref:hypothetical protein n=1 Tax=Azospirillum sp. SYSU D00513 TaxID=2812561 RepID=UPI001A974AD3|nr:hypothetical protein [Azospirillum sp. SYSU D00513]